MNIEKIKETIEEVKQTIKYIEEHLESGQAGCDAKMQLESEKIKLWALEKQVPQKLKKEIKTRWLPIYECKCGNIMDYYEKGEFKYCPHCGQKLNWRV